MSLVARVPSKRYTDKVQCYEPATMKYLGFFSELKPDEVGEFLLFSGGRFARILRVRLCRYFTFIILNLNLIGYLVSFTSKISAEGPNLHVYYAN
ncbi:hypothetical protein U1Q18_049727 [Sarracenia purpurea var. burkii]